MKILALIPSLSMGGAERVLTNLANDWCGRPGWEVRILTLSGDEASFYRLDERISHFALGMANPSERVWRATLANWQRIRAVSTEIEVFQPDVTVGFMSQANVLVALASLGTGIPCLGSEHIYPPKIPLGRAWEVLRRYSYGLLYGVTALTRESHDWLLDRTATRRCWVIPNAAPYPIPAQLPHTFARAARRPDKKRLLAVGRLTFQKGFDLLLHAFAKLVDLHGHWDLVIVGDGELLTSLRNLAFKLKISESVFFPGAISNIGDWYAESDLFVLSSRFEGFGNVLAEALTYGLPSVSFDCPHGPRDIVHHGIDGLLVPAEDIDGLATALKQLMLDDEQRESMAIRAVEARDNYSMERIHGYWDRVLNECIGDKNRLHYTATR